MSTKNTMKHNAVITTMLLLVLFTFSACASVTPDDQTSKDSNITENGASTGCSDYDNTSTPEFFNDLGKTLDELKNEHPEGNVIVRLMDFQTVLLYALEPQSRNIFTAFSAHRVAMLKRL